LRSGAERDSGVVRNAGMIRWLVNSKLTNKAKDSPQSAQKYATDGFVQIDRKARKTARDQAFEQDRPSAFSNRRRIASVRIR
jgi:hypothetical protein